jgi:hypothetical protein
MLLEFYNKNTIYNLKLNYPDIYFSPEYGKVCEYSDNMEWECCIYKDLMYIYLKNPIVYDNIIYFDLITPYGYSGYYYEDINTFNEFIILFRNESKKKNYITEVVRQNPYINIKIYNYEIIIVKKLYAINVCDFEYYYKNILNCKKRNMYIKAIKNNYIFNINNIQNSMINDELINMYNNKMIDLNANKYYFFNDKYFNELNNMNNVYIAKVLKDNELVGFSIIFEYNNYIHYHLSCNNNSSNCITDFLICNLVKYFKNKIIILGCGIKNDDSLEKFKKSLSNITFNYVIYKNILNQEIYDKISKNINNDRFPKYR